MKSRALFGLFALKLAFTAFAVWFVAARVDLSGAFGALATIDPMYVSAAVVCALVQIWLASLRFMSVTAMVDSPLPHGESLRITFIGSFFGQAFATFISGDVMRIWLVARRGTGYPTAANAVLLDRVFGIAALVVLIIVGLPALLEVLPSTEMRASVVAVTAGFAGLIGGFVVLGWLLPARPRWRFASSPKFAWVGDLAGAARHILAAPAVTFVALLLGLAVQLLSVVSLYLLFRGMGAPVSATTCFMFIPFVMLMTMLPISFAGWGLREGAMVAAFGMAGVAPEATLLASIAFGLVILATSLPGLALWLSGGARMPAGAMSGAQKSPARRAVP